MIHMLRSSVLKSQLIYPTHTKNAMLEIIVFFWFIGPTLLVAATVYFHWGFSFPFMI